MKSLEVKIVKKLIKDIKIPGDKSISHRAVMLGAIAKGPTNISNFLHSEDCMRTVQCFRDMGIEITEDPPSPFGLRRAGRGQWTVNGKGLKGLKKPKDILYAGNSGTTVRLLSGILAGQNFESMITGDDSILKRPMKRIIDPLSKMGARIDARDVTYCPLAIMGTKLKAIEYSLPVASAQVKSCILLAGLYAEGLTKVIEIIPSRDHTERMLEFMGGKIKREPLDKLGASRGQKIVISAGELEGQDIIVPGDISSAAYFLVAAAIIPGSEITVKDVGVNPTRTGIVEVLHRMNVDIEVINERLINNEPRADIKVKYCSNLKGIKISGSLIPRLIDEIPIIAVLASQAQGETVIADAAELRVKESDRIATMATELKKIGIQVEETEDGMKITGNPGGFIRSSEVIQSHGDHRVAMSMAIAGLITREGLRINDTACIETSFPGFENMIKGF
ncbi:MAG: 3-phosphoshikimate 1-carboxyvinyltransferase [bacterium]